MWGGDDVVVFFFKQKTAYEMRISDWSSDVCSSDLRTAGVQAPGVLLLPQLHLRGPVEGQCPAPQRQDADLRRHQHLRAGLQGDLRRPIGRAPCRDSVCLYV